MRISSLKNSNNPYCKNGRCTSWSICLSKQTFVVLIIKYPKKRTKHKVWATKLFEKRWVIFGSKFKIQVLNVELLEDTTKGRFLLQSLLSVAEMKRILIIELMQEGQSDHQAEKLMKKEHQFN